MSEECIFEVNGVKLAIDPGRAVRIEEIRVGDRVKILDTSGYSGHKVHAGVVIGFEPFPDLPTILVAYLEKDYQKAEIKVAAINKKTEKMQMLKSVSDELFDRDEVLKMFDKQIAENQRKIDDLNDHKCYFTEKFGVYWKRVNPTVEA